MVSRATSNYYQENLENALKSIFSKHNVVFNARKVVSITNPNTGKLLEVDVWLPELDLGFEFQDEHHYKSTNYAHLPLAYYQTKDSTKQVLLRERSISLVVIPFWWDGSRESLISTIRFQRPELFGSDDILPISLNPPFEISPADFYIPEIGELMLASFPVSMSIFNENNWWLGEKYDGVRCCWNPMKNLLYSRSGIPLAMPNSFVDLMVPLFIDAELWCGRGNYIEAFQATRSALYSPDIRLIGFDSASPEHQSSLFENRFSYLLTYVPLSHPFIICPTRMSNNNSKHMMRTLREVISQQAEGLVIQKMGSAYIGGRSDYLWKLKAIQGDQEALVIKVDEAMNITVKFPNGTQMTLSPRDYTLHRPPMQGDIVTVESEDQARRSSPNRARAVRIREDRSWGDVLASYSEEQLFADKQKLENFTTRPLGYWTRSKMREELEKFARGLHKDPLVPGTWYSMVVREIKQFKSIRAVMRKYNSSFVDAIVDLFPDIKLRKKKFAFPPRKFYFSITNRREIFEQFAVDKQIDALNPVNWYSFTESDFRTVKGVHHMLAQYYDGKLSKALLHLFPDFKFTLDETQFKGEKLDQNTLHRHFFERFASDRNFNPLNPENWYSVSAQDIESIPGGSTVLKHYGDSLVRTLVMLFPDVNFDLLCFKRMPNNFWKDESNRRLFLDMFARKMNFNPYVAQDWYQVSRHDIISQGGTAVIRYHKNSHRQALIDLYPTLSFDFGQSANKENQHWTQEANRRLFFEEYAHKNHFNPLVSENWYSVTWQDIIDAGGGSVLRYHNGALSKALVDLFPDINFSIASLLKRKRRSINTIL